VLSKKRPVTVYCGNPQGRDPGETEPRGCYLVDVDDAGRIKPRFHAVDVVRWQVLDVPIDELGTEESLIGAVVEAVGTAQTETGRSIVARVRLTGRGPMHASLGRTGLLEDVQNEAREGLSSTEPFAWIESLRDQTRPEVDLEERRKADDFVGDLLRRLDATRAPLTGHDGGDAEMPGRLEPDDIDRILDELYAHNRARKYLRYERPDAAAVARALDEAESLLLDRLADEE
jgi:DNA repair exonuclease SbcCD nuclease subunit